MNTGASRVVDHVVVLDQVRHSDNINQGRTLDRSLANIQHVAFTNVVPMNTRSDQVRRGPACELGDAQLDKFAGCAQLELGFSKSNRNVSFVGL
jgi:hypothetical protein